MTDIKPELASSHSCSAARHLKKHRLSPHIFPVDRLLVIARIDLDLTVTSASCIIGIVSSAGTFSDMRYSKVNVLNSIFRVRG